MILAVSTTRVVAANVPAASTRPLRRLFNVLASFSADVVEVCVLNVEKRPEAQIMIIVIRKFCPIFQLP